MKSLPRKVKGNRLDSYDSSPESSSPSLRKLNQEGFEFLDQWDGSTSKVLVTKPENLAQSPGPMWQKENIDSVDSCLTSTYKPFTPAHIHILTHDEQIQSC